MKAIFSILVFLTYAILSTVGAATISSKSTGGEWSSTSTWTGGVIPGISDDVIINGNVIVNDHSCNNLTVSSGATLVNYNGYNRTLNIFGNIVNNGTIADNNSGSLSIRNYGDITNNGAWSNYAVVLKATHVATISQASGKYFSGTIFSNDAVTDTLRLGSDVNFRSLNFNANASSPNDIYIATNGHSAFFKYCNLNNVKFYSYDLINLDSSVLTGVEFRGGASIDGLITIYNGCTSYDDLTVLGTIKNYDGYNISMSFYDLLTNKGSLINSNSGGLYFYLFGDIQNEGIYKPVYTYLQNGNAHQFGQTSGKFFEGTFQIKGSDTVILTTNVMFKKSNLYGDLNSTPLGGINTNGHNLTLDECTIRGFNFWGSDAIDLDKSTITEVHFRNNALLSGVYTAYSVNYFYGAITNNGTIQNWNGYAVSLNVYGKLTNNGTIHNSPSGYLSVSLYNDLHNAGTYKPQYTYFRASKPLNLSQDAGTYFEGTFITNDTLDEIKLNSDLVFKKIRFDGTNTAPYSSINTNGHKLTIDSSYVTEVNFIGNDTANLNGSTMYNWKVNGNSTLQGKMTLYNVIYFNGDVANEGIIINDNGYAVTLELNGKFTNNGQVIDNNSGYLEVYLNNDILNNGIYRPAYTRLRKAKSISFSQATNTFFEGTYSTADTLAEIKLNSDVVFKKIRFDGTDAAPYSTINTNGYKLTIDSSYVTEINFVGDDTANLNGCKMYNWKVNGNSTLLGKITLYAGIFFNGDVANEGTIINDNGYAVTLELNGKFTNNGQVIDNNSGYLNVHLNNDILNNGIYRPAYTRLRKAKSISFSQATNTFFEGTYITTDTLAEIKLNSDLVFKKIRFDGTDAAPYSTINTNGYKLTIDSSYVTEVNFAGDDTANLNGCKMYNWKVNGNSTLIGKITLYAGIFFNGDITNEGILINDNGYSVSVDLNGKFTNNGQVINNTSGYLNLQLNNDLVNNGIYSPAYTQLRKAKLISFSQAANTIFEGRFEPFDTLTSIQLLSDVTFKKATLYGAAAFPYAKIITNGNKLVLDSCSINKWRIQSSDTLDLNGTTVSNTEVFGNPKVDGFITLDGPFSFANNVTILGTIQNWAGYTRELNVQGDLINDGEIKAHINGGSVNVRTYKNIVNNGVYAPSSTSLLGKSDRNISGRNAKGMQGTFYLQDSITLVGENILPNLTMNQSTYLTIDSSAMLICDGFNYSRMSEITNKGRISTSLTDFNYYATFTYYNAKAEFKKDTPILKLQIENYGNQQHPSASNAVNAWWRLKPYPVEVKDSIKKLRLYYKDSDLNGKIEDNLRVYFSSNAGLNWSRIENGVTKNTATNEISILNAPPYGHYLLSDNDLGVVSFNPVIERAEPRVFGNKGQVTIYGFGIGLNDSMNVYLKKTGSANIVADTVYLTDAVGESFIATFTVDLATIGTYSMVLELAGKADLELPSYFEIETAERPEPWAVLGGRNKFLINRWQTFTINYGNKANTDAIGVPLFFLVNDVAGMEVEFPDFQIGVPKSFVDDGWTQFRDTTIDLYYTSNEIAGFEGKNMRVYAFYVPTISAMSSQSVRIRIKVPSVADLDMNVWITDPLFEGIPGKQKAGTPPEVSACIAAAAAKYSWDKAIGFIPGYDCYKLAYKVTETGVGEVLKDPNEPEKPSTWGSWAISAWGWAWSVADCAGDLIPVAKGVKIGKELLDIAFDMKGNYDATQDCWDKFKAKQKSKLDSKGVYSFDPNEIAGPSGYGADGYISEATDMVYTIFFENKDSATAAAQEVLVVDTLDKTKFDFNTLSFQSVTIADSAYEIQSFAKEFRIVVDLAPRIHTLVQVSGSLDTASGELKVSYVSLDRSTMELQEDVDLGFLPPNKTKPQGEGNFSYAIGLKSGLPHDAQIVNKALIYFDANKPIETNVHKNTIDKIAPSSMVSGLPSETKDSSFVVNWYGTDPGCGIQNYTIMVSANDSDFVVWKSNTSHTSDTFFGQNKTQYAFYSIATDSLGLTEGVNTQADASTYTKVNTGSISDLQKEEISIATTASSDRILIFVNEPSSVSVFDINGKLIMQSKLVAGTNSLLTNTLIPQNYVVVVRTSTKEISKKIVILPH